MAHDVHDPFWAPKVTVPVRRVGAKWEFFYGGDVPVREGTLGELVIGVAQIVDPAFRAMVSAETVLKILPQGTVLLAALSDRSGGGAKVGALPWPDVPLHNVPMGTTRFEKVVIGPAPPPAPHQKGIGDKALEGGLWLRLRGLERSELACSTVLLPEGSPKPVAVSLNHAFTMLSKQYETHRISNTGNVYTRFFYMEANNKWYPLADLREGVRERAERGVINAAWAQVEEALGWCHLPDEKPKGRRSGNRPSDGRAT